MNIIFDLLCFTDPMIELITGPRIGIMSILDEELIVPGGSDAGFLEKLGDNQVWNDGDALLMAPPVMVCPLQTPLTRVVCGSRLVSSRRSRIEYIK